MFTFFLLNEIDLLGLPLLAVMIVLVIALSLMLFFALKGKNRVAEVSRAGYPDPDEASIIASVLEHSGSSSAILDTEGFFRYVNEDFEEMFRPGDRPLTGKNIRDFSSLNKLQRSFDNENSSVVPFLGKDGITYMIKYVPVRGGDNETIGWFLRMIPDLMEQENDFDLSHELKTPLHAVLGFSELMKNDTKLTGKQEKLLDKIIYHSRQLDRKIKRIVGGDSFDDSGTKDTKEEMDRSVKKVLVVDDVSINRTLLKLMLRRHGLNVQEASNGEAALQVLKSWPADLILMDLSMPVLDGIETVKVIRNERIGGNPRIIAVTATQRYSLEALKESGFDDLMQKPFKEEDLLSHLGIEKTG